MQFFSNVLMQQPGRRELANQHDVVHGKAGSTESLSDFAPKTDAASATPTPTQAAVTLALSGSDSTVRIQLSQTTPLPQPPRSILHNPTCSGYFIETVRTAALCQSRSY